MGLAGSTGGKVLASICSERFNEGMNSQKCYRYLKPLSAASLLLVSFGGIGGMRAEEPAPMRPKLVLESNEERGGPEGDRKKALGEFLAGTKWLMYDRADRELEFRKDGKFALPAWASQGISAVWRATGPNQVTVTVVSQKFRNLTAVFNFNEDRTAFTGHDLDKKREVTRSPRVPWDDRKQQDADDRFRRPF